MSETPDADALIVRVQTFINSLAANRAFTSALRKAYPDAEEFDQACDNLFADLTALISAFADLKARLK